MSPPDQESTGPATRTLVATEGLPVRQLRAFTLEIRPPKGPSRTERFHDTRVTVGARPECDVVLSDETASRLHFELTADDVGYRLRDLGSRNGTRVDGYRTNDIYLRPGSTVRAGHTELVFRTLEEERPIGASEPDFGALVGRSVPMREVFATLAKAAPSSVTVLIEGETGTGKELVAREVHAASDRSGGPFVVFDCAAVSPSLLESELFGHERGAFTGAAQARAGLLEEADGGTLFLDELGELPIDLQPKLLRALERKAARRVGGGEERAFDVRFVAATNRDLSVEINRGSFRADLYFRLAVVQVKLPPLRERTDDIPRLVEHLLVRHADRARADEVLARLGPGGMRGLRRKPWPGNVRELSNYVLRSLLLELDDPPTLDTSREGAPKRAGSPAPSVDLDVPFAQHKADVVEAFERDYLAGQLERSEGNISAAARASGLERMYFKRLLKKRLPE